MGSQTVESSYPCPPSAAHHLRRRGVIVEPCAVGVRGAGREGRTGRAAGSATAHSAATAKKSNPRFLWGLPSRPGSGQQSQPAPVPSG